MELFCAGDKPAKHEIKEEGFDDEDAPLIEGDAELVGEKEGQGGDGREG